MENEKPKKQGKSNPTFSCSVCETIHSSMKSAILCESCNNLACKHHSKNVGTLFFCDTCIKNEIKCEILSQNALDIKKLEQELKAYSNREEAMVKEIHIKTKTTGELEWQLNLKLKENDEEIENLNKKIASKITEKENNEDKYIILQDEKRELEENLSELFKKLTTEKVAITKIEREKKNFDKQISDLENKGKELINRCNETIPYRRIRNTTCIKCHENIKTSLKDDIIAALSTSKSSSLIESVVNSPRTRDKNNTPCICRVI
ncbi:hypothetical protein SteCoe_38825 [Stentor coeruleus]|uniref:Uncharacterized protein n=1 Tax=Stentor coeruleus TaxID=5963 RepID=A0A1R2AKZ8_9CILI|nr:hypothetical protein SteCoe_38825 [Stentor coeruleus]